MDWELWTAGAASAGNLALALVVFQKGRKDPLGIPLLLLCLVTATWNLGELLYGLTRVDAWHLLDICVSPWTAPLALHVVVAFVGRLRQLRWALVAGYVWGAVIAAWPLAYSATAGAAPSKEVPGAWPVLFLLGIVGLLLAGFALLVRHLWRQTASEERARTRLFMGALLVGGVLSATEMLDLFVPGLLSLGSVGSLLSVGLLIVAVLRFDLFERAAPVLHLFYAVSIALAFVAASFLAVRLFSSQLVLLLVALSLIALALVAAVREWSGWAIAQREQVRHLAGLGRMSAQMAHDLKNPLAALKGTVQFLEVELEEPDKSIGEVERPIRRLADQVDRLDRTIEKYQGLGRVEPALESANLRTVVGPLLDELEAEWPEIDLVRELEEVPDSEIDPELLRLTVENLVRNAAEAMPEGGLVTVSLRPENGRIRLAVADEGVGMSARGVERATDDFYTTKAQGSGLGLAFARRVVRAHGGTLRIESALGVGTTVIAELPVEVT